MNETYLHLLALDDLEQTKPPATAQGTDIDEHGYGIVTEQKLYQLIRQSENIIDRQFEIEFFDSGVEAFAFTFG